MFAKILVENPYFPNWERRLTSLHEYKIFQGTMEVCETLKVADRATAHCDCACDELYRSLRVNAEERFARFQELLLSVVAAGLFGRSFEEITFVA